MKNTKYFYDKYKGQKCMWRDNYQGILCGFTDNMLIIRAKDQSMVAHYVEDGVFKFKLNPRCDTRLFYIGDEGCNNYYLMPPSAILDMDFDDSILVGKERDLFVGNKLIVEGRLKTISKISKNVCCIWYTDGTSQLFRDNARINAIYIEDEFNVKINIDKLKRGERLYDNELMKNY